VPREGLEDAWRAQASRLGLEWEQLVELTGRVVMREPASAEVEAAASSLASPGGLTRDRASFTRRDVIQAWCDRLPQGADTGMIESLADEFLASEHSVPLAIDVGGLTHRDVIRRADGQVIAATAEERRHSTPELLAIEKRLIEGALSRRGDGSGVVPERTVEAALRRRPTLSGEQAEMLRRLTREGHGVQIVTGKAGTGKTFALDAAREAWESECHTVIGAAVARRAARELEDGAGIESTSLAALLQDLRAGGERGLAPEAVVVVDEASMAGTRDLAELLEFADSAQAKVVLVGDPHQLPEIHAGGAFRALITRTDPIELNENRRQSQAWERDALDYLREGKPGAAIDRYERQGRVVLGEGAEELRQRLVTDWWESAAEGDAAMIAVRRDDVADLNLRARALMHASGQLGPDALWVGEREFATGDHVVTLKNARHLGVVNGTRGVVTDVNCDPADLVVRTSDGRDIRLPWSYLESQTERGGRTLDYGYAITGHKAQGMTTGKAFVLGTDDLYREWGYVAMSRGGLENHLYVVAPRARERDEYAPEEQRRDPIEALVGSLEYSHAQTAAVDVAACDGIGRMTTAELVAERARLAERVVDPPKGRSGELARLGGRRTEAERSAAVARERVEELERQPGGTRRGSTQSVTAARALADQAEERAAQLRRRDDELERSMVDLRQPAASHAQDAVRYAAIGDELHRRGRARARAAIVERPEYLVRELGSYPLRRSERRIWDRAARGIESYRQEFNVRDRTSALGEEPRELRQRQAWRASRHLVDRAVWVRSRGSERGRDSGRGIT
jgi:hypothetical protein